MNSPLNARRKLLCLLISAAVGQAVASENTEQPTLTVSATPQKNTTAVNASARLGNLGQQDIRNTPWSVQSISSQQIQQQQLKSVTDLYRYLPSILAAGHAVLACEVNGAIMPSAAGTRRLSDQLVTL